MNKSVAELCATCRAVDFTALVWPPAVRDVLQGRHGIDLGTTQSIRDRRDVCELCDLFVTWLDRADGPDIVQNAGDRCQLLSTRFEEEILQGDHMEEDVTRETTRFVARWIAVQIIPVSFTGFVGPVMPDRFYKADVANPTTREATTEARPWNLLHLQGCTNPVPTVDQLCQGPIELLPPPKRTRFSGRLREDTINPRLYHHWVQLCKKHHGTTCWPVAHPTLEGLRVIDVQDMAVRLAPDVCNYVVLSYCWGSAKTTLLTQDNMHRLTETRGLSIDVLPDTIVDAIDVTRKAGLRYLWVDALCIVQDDPIMLQSQIPQMARIYEQGEFTIMAAAAQNADHGLAGVRAGTRTVVTRHVILSDLSLIVVPEPATTEHGWYTVSDDPKRTGFGCLRWRSRSWTLQEEMFSRKRLYFSTDRVSWQCPSGFYQEEIVKEIPAACVSNEEKSELLDTDPWLTMTIMDMHFEFMSYEHLVSEYSRRRLSFASDTLNALAGLYEEISRKYQIQFIWGHPDTWFLESLIWNTNYECVQNKGTQRTTDATGITTAIPFPTWSWGAWVGNLEDDNVYYRGSTSSLSYHSKPGIFKILVYRCRLDKKLGLVPYSCINTIDLLRHQHSMQDNGVITQNRVATMPNDWVGAPRQIIPPVMEERTVIEDSGHLQFWTSIANVYLVREDAEEARIPFHYKLLNSNGEVISRRTNIQSTAGLDWNDTARYKQYPPAIVDMREYFQHGIHEILAVAIAETEPSHSDISPEMNILLVVEADLTFYRRGSTTIPYRHWPKLDTSWCLVTLG